MIGRGSKSDAAPAQEEQQKGFDAFNLRLGDVMRGERATMGKSLLDVQRELKIKAAYIAAIENADPSAFDTPGFIAGYVRSYARYLGMEPDWAFECFCKESGFATAHGMDKAASRAVETSAPATDLGAERDIFNASSTPFRPAADPVFAAVEPRAVGSVLVLLALIAGLGYGGWSVLQEVQRVQFAPVEQTPLVVSDIDPLAGGGTSGQSATSSTQSAAPSVEAMDRLSRPQALDAPVMVARDGPIASLDPREVGSLYAAPDVAPVISALAEMIGPMPLGVETTPASGIQVTAEPAPAVQLVAVRPAWVRVKSPEGSVLFEGIMNAGETYTVPQTEDPATLRIGESGAVYFALNGVHYGPVGPRGSVTSNLALSSDNLQQTYSVADISADTDLAAVVNVAQAAPAQ